MNNKSVNNRIFAIAIDGPVGAGKSTLAKLCADALGFIYVDTGALYRAVALFCVQNQVAVLDEKAVAAALAKMDIKLIRGLDSEDTTQKVILNGEDVTEEIRLPEISLAASKVSAMPAVRAFLLDLQRDFAKKQSVIMDGRDIGTVILPNADLKLFITTAAEIRAKRRYDELMAKGIETTYEQVLKELNERDHNDRTREIAPLKQAEDAYPIDTGDMDLQASFSYMLAFIKDKLAL